MNYALALGLGGKEKLRTMVKLKSKNIKHFFNKRKKNLKVK